VGGHRLEHGAEPSPRRTPSKTLGRARLQSGIRRPGLPAGEWYRVLERQPEPGLSNDGYALPGYVWLKVNGRDTHWAQADLEVQHGDPNAGDRDWTPPSAEDTPLPRFFDSVRADGSPGVG
jgi:hypothetical protein